MSDGTDHDQAGTLRFGQVGIANLRVRRFDIQALAREMRERVERAPKLFARAPLVLDLGGLSECPDRTSIVELLDRLREAGVCPVALAYGTNAIAELAEAIGLPLLAKFRENYESGDAPRKGEVRGKSEPSKSSEPTPAPTAHTLIQDTPVRSGQQLYAHNRDLVLTAAVGAGAEIIADGSIHVYGALRGRALAGAAGNRSARIFCRDFDAELVAIAGHYRVIEELPEALRGRPVQVLLRDERIEIEPLA